MNVTSNVSTERDKGEDCCVQAPGQFILSSHVSDVTSQPSSTLTKFRTETILGRCIASWGELELNELWQSTIIKHKPYVHMFLCGHVKEPRRLREMSVLSDV